MPIKVRDEITYPYLNFNGCTVEVWEGISIFIPYFIMDLIILSRLGLKLFRISPKDLSGFDHVKKRRRDLDNPRNLEGLIRLWDITETRFGTVKPHSAQLNLNMADATWLGRFWINYGVCFMPILAGLLWLLLSIPWDSEAEIGYQMAIVWWYVCFVIRRKAIIIYT